MQEEKKYDIELDGNETLVRKYDWRRALVVWMALQAAS